MSAVLTPQNETDACDIVQEALRDGTSLDIRGGGTRSSLGRPVHPQARAVSTSALTGITLYEPAELVMSARAGTPLSHIEAELASRQQMLPFEPLDHRVPLGTDGAPTIGGVFASNASGPRRLSVGAARDFCLGIRFINGRGESIASGGRVMKNVTGLDLVKLQCGAMGTLGLLTEITFKVLPAPRRVINLNVTGLEYGSAIEAMSVATTSPFEVAAAGFCDGSVVLRVEGFENSVAYRASRLSALLDNYGAVSELQPEAAATFWRRLPTPDGYDRATHELWRIALPQSRTAQCLSELLGVAGAAMTLDWAGGLVWLSLPVGHDLTIHQLARSARGAATLVAAGAERRAASPVYQPLGEPELAIAQRVKNSIDPGGVFNRGRMYKDV